jgi:hypothetical protein
MKKIKSGIKTSEFALTALAAVLGCLIAAGVVEVNGAGTWDKLAGAVIALLASLGYTLGRSKVKAAAAEADKK